MAISPVLVDLYEFDLGGKPDLAALAAAGRPWCGVGLKASEGTYYPQQRPAWFQKFWPIAASCAGDRYGVDWFRYAYHYYIVGEDPVAQADWYLEVVKEAGGFSVGDLRSMVDVETAEQPAGATAAQVVDGVTAFADRIYERIGARPILYGGSYLRDLGVTDRMGCDYLSTAAYGSRLPPHLYTGMGWPLERLFSWQYQGTEGFTGPRGYPQESPLSSTHPVDLSAVTICNGAPPDEQIAWIVANALIPATVDC